MDVHLYRSNGRNMLVITMMKTKELSMGIRECIVTLKDSEDAGKDCKAGFKALGVPVSTVINKLKNPEEHYTLAHLKSRSRKSKIFL